MDDLEKYKGLLNHEDDASSEGEFSQFLQKSGAAKVPGGRGKAAIWEQIASNLDGEEQSQAKSRTFNPWILSGIAAAILLLVVFVLSLESAIPSQTIHVVSESGNTIEHKLPDGSSAQLNASSSILYSEDWDRTLSLSGEAFFEVVKGSTFTVTTRYGDVQVLGTSFNVFARDSIFEVSCKTGRVQVTIPEKPIIELTPGKSILARLDTVFKTSLTPEEIGNWTSGEFYFSDRPIREVLDEVERQYSARIDIRNGDTLRFTGYFFKDADLSSTLDLICLPLGLQFKKQNEVYVISESAEEL